MDATPFWSRTWARGVTELRFPPKEAREVKYGPAWGRWWSGVSNPGRFKRRRPVAYKELYKRM